MEDLDPALFRNDWPHVLMFRGRNDPFCNYMDPICEELEKELKCKIFRIDVWKSAQSMELLQQFDALGKDKCGGVPYFFNKKTKYHICGATTKANLKKLMKNEECDAMLPPDAKELDFTEDSQVSEGMTKFWEDLRAKAKEKMARREADGGK